MKHINLRVNASETVVLKGLGSAGYRWSIAIDNPRIVRVDRLAANPSPSGSHEEKYQVIGLAAGKTIVHFTQTRSFEPNKPPHDTYEVEVRVT